MSNLHDTFMNIVVFAFIGLLIWLYFKPTNRDFREGDVLHSLADISKAQRLLGYLPRYSVAEGLKETIDWYLEKYAVTVDENLPEPKH